MMWMIIMIRSMMHYFHQVLKLACIINLIVDFITEIKLPKKLKNDDGILQKLKTICKNLAIVRICDDNDGILSSTNRLYPLL